MERKSPNSRSSLVKSNHTQIEIEAPPGLPDLPSLPRQSLPAWRAPIKAASPRRQSYAGGDGLSKSVKELAHSISLQPTSVLEDNFNGNTENLNEEVMRLNQMSTSGQAFDQENQKDDTIQKENVGLSRR